MKFAMGIAFKNICSRMMSLDKAHVPAKYKDWAWISFFSYKALSSSRVNQGIETCPITNVVGIITIEYIKMGRLTQIGHIQAQKIFNT